MTKRMLLLSALGFCSVVSAGELAEMHDKLAAKSPHDFVNPLSKDEMNDPIRGITSIGIERTHCFGPCPIYTATIDKDGTVNYKGERFVEKMGEFRGEIDPTKFARLAQFIREEGFSSLANNYAIGATDQSTTYTLVKTKVHSKVVENYGNAGPAKLWAIEQLIDKMVEGSHLTPVKSGAGDAAPAK